MRRLITFLLFSFLPLTSTLFAQWVEVDAGLPNWSIGLAIDAIDANTAVITVRIPYPANRQVLYKTTNSGTSWTQLIWPTIEYGEEAIDISIIDANNIWFGTGLGRIYYTSDGGISWHVQFYDQQKTTFINYIEMFDLNNGIAMGDPASLSSNDPAVILKTTDGGSTWVRTNQSNLITMSGDTWRRVDFTDPLNGFFEETMTPHSPQMYKTVDGGITWTSTNFQNYAHIFKFYDQNIGIAGECIDCEHFIISRTTDGGNSWTTNSQIYTAFGNDIEFVPGDPNKVWFTEYKSLFYSEDGGVTWAEYSLAEGDLKGRDLVFTDAESGWLLCDDGKVYRTTNNGGGQLIIITDVDDVVIPSEFTLNQNYPNPFNPATNISFSIPEQIHVSLKIFDITGQEISTLVDSELSAGTHNVNFTANNLSSGIYLYTLKAGNFSETKKFVLMK